jgi:putative membrane protein insertion efficiency factor
MIRAALLLLIRVYQLTLSRLLGPSCRFEPSCSHYTATCIERFGALRGSWLGIKRIGRCHPFHPGGFDPPPPPDHQHRHCSREAHHG